ncbi:MAG: hypothetical protein HFH43_08970 [Lachnospiraceae bacterium]|jgi:hypothetical protein|nr:hypothetical protein [Lachnospiraceae bacterium]
MKIKVTTPNKIRIGTVIRNNKLSYTIRLEGDYKGTMKILKKWLDGIDVPNGYKVEEIKEKTEKEERYITCATYERALKRTEKAVLRNMGY